MNLFKTAFIKLNSDQRKGKIKSFDSVDIVNLAYFMRKKLDRESTLRKKLNL